LADPRVRRGDRGSGLEAAPPWHQDYAETASIVVNRPANDLTYRFPLIVESVARLRSRSCIIDGEAVVCNRDGVPSFDHIRYRRHDSSAFLYAFDLIELQIWYGLLVRFGSKLGHSGDVRCTTALPPKQRSKIPCLSLRRSGPSGGSGTTATFLISTASKTLRQNQPRRKNSPLQLAGLVIVTNPHPPKLARLGRDAGRRLTLKDDGPSGFLTSAARRSGTGCFMSVYSALSTFPSANSGQKQATGVAAQCETRQRVKVAALGGLLVDGRRHPHAGYALLLSGCLPCLPHAFPRVAKVLNWPRVP
jgi:hypothetical protein